MRRLTGVAATVLVAAAGMMAAWAAAASALPAPRATGASGNLAIVAGHNATLVPGTNSPIQALGVATSGTDTYVADAVNHVVEKITASGTVSVVAGIPGRGGLPVPGPATSSPLGRPAGVAVDSAGDVFIADQSADAIEEVSPSGTLQVVAGVPGSDGLPTPGPATASKMSGPSGVAVDSAGDLYIADSNNDTVEEVIGGTLSILAGTAGTAGQPAPGPAASSDLSGPFGVAVGPAGSVYIGDRGNDVVEKVDTDTHRTLSILAGTIHTPGPTSSNELNEPEGVYSTGSTVYIADVFNQRIVSTPAGTGHGPLTVVAGNGNGAPPIPGPATSSPLELPTGVSVASDGTLRISDFDNYSVESVDTSGTLSVLAGAVPSGPTVPGPATATQLNSPAGVGTDAAGDLYVADALNRQVYEVTPGGTLTVVAGTGTYGLPANGPAKMSPFRAPHDVAVDAAGNIYISDSSADTVEKVAPDGTLSLVAGVPGASGAPTPGPANVSHLGQPMGLAVDGAGNLYIADETNDVVEKVTPDGTLSVLAGIAGQHGAPTPGPATMSDLYDPVGLGSDAAGDVYIGDVGTHLIEKVTPTDQLSVIAGVAGTAAPEVAGPALSSPVYDVGGLAVDAAGDVYLADYASHLVAEVSASGTMSILAGQASYTSLPTPGLASASGLYSPEDVALDSAGNAYVTDGETADVVELFGPPRATTTAVACAPVTLVAGTATTCSATVTDAAALPVYASAPAGTVAFASSPATGTFGTAGSCTLATTGASTAACSVTFTPAAAGSYKVGAAYAGDSVHAASTAVSAALTATAHEQPPPKSGKASVGRVTVKKSTASVPVTCTGDSACSVKLTLSVVETVKGKKVTAVTVAAGKKKPKAKKKTVILGTKQMTVPAGKTVTVTVSLNRTGAALLKKHPTLKVKLAVTQGKSTVRTVTVTFKAPKPKRKKPKQHPK